MAINDFISENVAKASSFWVSLVRTYAPKVAVAVIAWFSVTLGFQIPEDQQLTVTVLLVGLAEALWYLVARIAEEQGARHGISWLVKAGGYMLGVPKAPKYAPKHVEAPGAKE